MNCHIESFPQYSLEKKNVQMYKIETFTYIFRRTDYSCNYKGRTRSILSMRTISQHSFSSQAVYIPHSKQIIDSPKFRICCKKISSFLCLHCEHIERRRTYLVYSVQYFCHQICTHNLIGELYKNIKTSYIQIGMTRVIYY